ncbi:hypothetical protein RGE_19120 [Rubrivivax gelatinosus IL144]|uniref:Uncharacterized protein n=2 Tax=Rubrivivax gelatinosus TaxID=28068 RepID=I0HQG6_RUBGI|nr:hypothetical protein RGE_19120 [Rubrivivax gelatinosus IL144]
MGIDRLAFEVQLRRPRLREIVMPHFHGVAGSLQGFWITGLACLLWPASGFAQQTSWTNAAPGPFWDLPANWSAGAPTSSSTDALLGAFDTTLRSGSFSVGSLSGTGTLTMPGGELSIAQEATVGALEVQGGSFSGGGTLTAGSLVWRSGSLGPDVFDQPAVILIVNGTASIQGPMSLGLGFSTRAVSLLGDSTWEDCAGVIDGEGRLYVGASGVLHDRALSSPHRFDSGYGGLVIAGQYEKTGASTTSFSGQYFANSGSFAVNEGAVSVFGFPGASWVNTGTVRLAGGDYDVTLFRGSFLNTGRVDVDAGRMNVSVGGNGGLISSSGDWSVGAGGTLVFTGDILQQRFDPAVFDGGTMSVDGLVQFSSGRFEFRGSATLSAPGRVEVLDGAELVLPGASTLGALKIARPYVFTADYPPVVIGYGLSSVEVDGALSVGTLEWADGHLQTQGPVTVSGQALLTQDPDLLSWLQSMDDAGKRMDVAFTFNGGAIWDGNSDLYGQGSIRVGPGAVFEDRTRVIETPGVVRVARVDNDGVWLKTGAGHSRIESAFFNRGTVHVLDAGELEFTGALDNAGTLQATRSRLVVAGPLAQLDAVSGVLSGGRYVMRDGRIVLAGNSAPIVDNRADVVLDGPSARLLRATPAGEVDALSSLARNAGALTLRHGAELHTAAAQMTNEGRLVVDDAALIVGPAAGTGVFRQQGAAAATWLDGVIRADRFSFEAGVFGAGGDGTIGTAWLDGVMADFGPALVFDVDIAGAGQADLVFTPGAATLQGTLSLDFSGTVAPGTYRIFVAEDGVAGRFSSLESELGPRYQLSAVYGDTYVDLSISAVPEPAAAMQLLAGLGLIGMLHAGRTRRRAGPVAPRLRRD